MGSNRNYSDDDGVKHVVHHYPKSGGIAALLEVIPGLLFQTFGIGHIYAGHVARGLFFMFSYWVVACVNALLCYVLIGFITFPLCWIGMLIISPIWAARSCGAR